MATTADEWLRVLAKRLDARQQRVALNRAYSTGDARLPEMGANTKESWKAFQKKARTNFGGLTCSAVSNRMIPIGVRVGSLRDSEAVRAARKVWRDNRLDIVFADAIWNMLSTSLGYLVTGIRQGEPIITSEKPEMIITAPDPAQPWRARAALKAWRDTDDGFDYALVWVPGRRQLYRRKSVNSSGTPWPLTDGDTWETVGEPEEHTGGVPVFVLDNKDGVAEFEPHIDVIDRINLGKLQRLVITAMQAYKQRAIKGLPDKDDDGNDIDWTKVFDPAPGAIWDLPDGIDIWESPATDVRPLLEAEKTDARDFAAVSETSVSTFIPDGQNQSAEGAANAEKGEVGRAKDRIKRVTSPMSAAILEALRVQNLDDGSTVDILWDSPEHISLDEKTRAATQARAAGRSARWVARNIFGMSPEEIDEDEADLAAEQLQAFTLTGGGDGGGAAA